MLYFLDTSALVKRYRYEPGTQTVDGIFSEKTHSITLSAVSICEVARALDRHLQKKELRPEDFEKAMARFYVDLHSARIAIVEMRRHLLFRANELIFRYHLSPADAIVLASSLALTDANPVFVCSDTRSGLLDAAKACHLSTLNPLAV